MALPVLVIGRSGSGKTYSLKILSLSEKHSDQEYKAYLYQFRWLNRESTITQRQIRAVGVTSGNRSHRQHSDQKQKP